MVPQITITCDLTPENLKALKLLAYSKMTSESDDNTPAETLDSLEGFDLTTEEEKKPAKKSVKPKKTETPAEEPEAPAEESEPLVEGPKISKTDVRAVALKLSKAGKQDVLKEIFTKYGGSKLSDISEENYSALMKDLEAANA